MRNILLVIAAALVLTGCTEQRDIYTTASPALYVEGDWETSLHTSDMSMNATAMIYSEDGNQELAKKYFRAPKSVVVPLNSGMYNVLLFNGMMYTETNNKLDDIYFRNTNRLSTFEAVVKEGVPNGRLVRSPGEYIASNYMELLTSGCTGQRMSEDVGYHLKYKDGKNGYPTPEDYIAESLYMTPFAVSYQCQVVVTIVNASSIYASNGAVRGFVGSVFMASREPSHMDVTHQFRLNDFAYIGDPADDTGTIRSPLFVTFGPPLDIPDRVYTLEVSIVLINGDDFIETIDITSQIAPIIDKIKDNLNAPQPIEIDLTIPLTASFTLPIVDGVGNIGVDGWTDDEIIIIPIRRP